ncbi:hypothetical protein [Enterobacter sp. A103]|uniref:hypothetical protein n=1 Tax=Enterobacter sp. A103 TaxID=3102785 RepID=UPI002ACA78DB|nr:hypothetical protein [Enterobacter sp. A103]MDZ5641836.1 hypothetical protein [Enterobacter sp. A103]
MGWLAEWEPWQQALSRIAPDQYQAALERRADAFGASIPDGDTTPSEFQRRTEQILLNRYSFHFDPDNKDPLYEAALTKAGADATREILREIYTDTTRDVLQERNELSFLDSPWDYGEHGATGGAGPSSVHTMLSHQSLLDGGAWRFTDALSAFTSHGALLHYAPQSVLLGDSALGICSSLSEAWLLSLSQDPTGSLSETLLDSIFHHSARLPGQPAGSDTFLQALTALQEGGERTTRSLDSIVHSVVSATTDLALTLHTANHALALARQTLNGKVWYCFYDPNLGDVRLPAVGTGEADLKSLLSQVLDIRTGYGPETLAGLYQTLTRNGEYYFSVQNVDVQAAVTRPEFQALKTQLTADMLSPALLRSWLDTLSSAEAPRSAAVQIMDAVQLTQRPLATDILSLTARVNAQVTAAGYQPENILPDSARFDKNTGKLTVSVPGRDGKYVDVVVETADLEQHSRTLFEDAVGELHLTGTAAMASEAMGKGIGALMTLRSIESMIDSLSQGDAGGGVAGGAWAFYGLASLTGADRIVMNSIAQVAGEALFRGATVPVQDMNSFISQATRTLLRNAGVESERILTVTGDMLGRLPVMAMAFGGWAISGDVSTLQEDEKNNTPGWKTDLDKADIGLDAVSTGLQTVAPFTGPAAPFLEAAAMLVMGVRMSIDDIVTDFNTGHGQRGEIKVMTSLLSPITLFIRPLIKLAEDNPVILGVENVDNLYRVSADLTDARLRWLDLTRGSLLSDDDLSEGNPASYAGDLTVDFSQVGEQGGKITLSGQHAPHSGLPGLFDKSDYAEFSGTRQVSSGIDYVMLGRGASYNRDGKLLASPGMQFVGVENGALIPAPLYSAAEHIIANAQNNIFLAPQNSAEVKDSDDKVGLYRYYIEAGAGDDILSAAEGMYEFDGGTGNNTIVGNHVSTEQTGQALVWDLTAQRSMQPYAYNTEPHRFVTALTAAQMKQAQDGHLAGVNDRSLLQKTQIEAQGVENLTGGYSASVSVTGSGGFTPGTFISSGAMQEVFIGDGQRNIISTGGGDDVIYRSAGNDVLIVNRSYSLHSAHGAEHSGYASDKDSQVALLAAGTDKQWVYTEVTLVMPDGQRSGDDLVVLEGAQYKDIRIVENGTGDVLVGYGDGKTTGLFVRVHSRSALAGLHFMTDDGVTFGIKIPEDSHQALSTDIEVIHGETLLRQNADGSSLREATGEDGYDITVSRGDNLVLPAAWKNGLLVLDANFSELRFRHDGLGGFVIDTGNDPRLNADNLQISVHEQATTALRLRTRDGYFFELVQTNGQWATRNVQANLPPTSVGPVLNSALLKALLTQGAGAVTPDALTAPEWHGRQARADQGSLVISDQPGGWLLGTDHDDTLMAKGGTTLLDGGAGHDTYVLKRGDGVVIIADSGTHSQADNWGSGKPDNQSNMVVLQDVAVGDIQSVVSTIDVGGVSQRVLLLEAKGTPALLVRMLASDVAGYQFTSADGVSFVYQPDGNGHLVQHIVGVDRVWWDKWYAPGSGHTDPGIAPLLARLEGRYDGAGGNDNIILNQPGVLVTPGRGDDTLHLRSGVGGGVELRAGDGNKTLYLDAAALAAQRPPVHEEPLLKGVKKEIWNNVPAGDIAGMQSLVAGHPADLTENDASLDGLLVAHQLVRLTGDILLHSNHSYRFRDFSSGQLSLDINGPSTGGYQISRAADGTVTVNVSDAGQGLYHFSLLAWNQDMLGSYDLHYGISDVVSLTDGNWYQPGVMSALSSSPADGGTPVSLNFRDFTSEDIQSRLSADGKTLTLSAGAGSTQVSVTLLAAQARQYLIVTGDGVVSRPDQQGKLTISEVNFSLQTDMEALDMRKRHGNTSETGQWLAVNGNARDNTFMAGHAQAVMFNGGAGEDVVRGSDLADILSGDAGNDLLLAGGGDDGLSGGDGADILDGGTGNDTAFYLGDIRTKQGVTIDLAQGRGQGADAEGDLLRSVENIRGSQYADILRGNSGNNVLEGDAGDDVLSGGGGQDVLRGGVGADTYLIRAGDRVILSKSVMVDGTEKDDAARDTVVLDVTGTFSWLKAGNDLVVACGSTAVVLKDWSSRASARNYRFILPGQDAGHAREFTGDEFDAWLQAGANPASGGTALSGVDYAACQTLLAPVAAITSRQDITGSAGNDTLAGDMHDNRLYGMNGNDILEGGAGGDFLDGGSGNDTVSYEHSVGAVRVDLSQTDSAGTVLPDGGDATGDMLSGIENLRGSSGEDALTGDAGPNEIEGGGGADTLNGGAGFDILSYAHSGAYWVPATDDHVHARDEQKGKNIGVYVDLAAQEACRGDAGSIRRDSIRGFEGVAGSAWADELYGDSGDNLFILNGFQNDGHNDQRDRVDGRSGLDTVAFTGGFYDRGVEVQIGHNGQAWWKGGINDAPIATFTDVENIIGSDGNDTLTGDGQDNVLVGGSGDDRLSGGGGADYLEGGAGHDNYVIADGDRVVISQWRNGDSTDTVTLLNAARPENMLFALRGDDLMMLTGDGKTSVTFRAWASGASNYVLVGGQGDSSWVMKPEEINSRLAHEATVMNGGFEAGSVADVTAGWTYTGGVSSRSSEHTEGGHSVDLSGGVLSQTLTEKLDRDMAYQVSVDVNKTTGTGVLIRLLAGNTELGRVNADSLTGWKADTWQRLTLTTGGNNALARAGDALRLEIVDGDTGKDNTMGVDNVRINVIPAPRTATVVNGGFEAGSVADVTAGWTYTGGVSSRSSEHTEGGHSVDLSGGVLSQTLTEKLDRGMDYQLSVDVNKTTGTGVLIRLFAGNTELGRVDGRNLRGWKGNGWQNLVLNVRGDMRGDAGESLRIEIADNDKGVDNTMGVDNVQLTKLVSTMGSFGDVPGEGLVAGRGLPGSWQEALLSTGRV